jgi:hypothetical protein
MKEELKNGSRDLTTRPSGNAVRERIEQVIKQEREGEIIALDFSRIGIIDYSCADEVVANIILTGLNENQRENIEVALERRDLAVMASLENGRKTVLGNLNNYLKETLEYIVNKGKITAKEFSVIRQLEANTSGTRLLNLHKKRLVKRIDEKKNGGRVWVYEILKGG